MKKLLYIFFALLSVWTFAFGSKDITAVNITSMESWQETVDISRKQQGKYNILIQAKDIAGNVGYAGPLNVYIDPKSDFPTAYIAYPLSGATVRGNVDIIGTCIDDDAVSYVELRIDGNPDTVRANGKEFWSYSLNTANLDEGIHTVEAWGVDVNDVKGQSIKTSFHLNRRQPIIGVTNKGAGALVSGKINLEGSVEDGNGIQRLFYSIDNGQKFEELRLTHNKKTNRSSFKAFIDTTKISDGPTVCWFKAVDKKGSEGIYTFLFFVDNKAPSLSFIYPNNAAESFPSVFSIAGKAFDGTGLESLKWVCGKDSGNIEITPGNSYWVKEFDFSKKSDKTAVVEIIAQDVAGNIVKAEKKVNINKDLDKPTLELVSPKNGERTGSALAIAGFATTTGKKEITEIRYKLDKGQEKRVKIESELFTVTENAVASGAHILTVYAVDSKGTAGTAQTINFTAEPSNVFSAEDGAPNIALSKPDGTLFVSSSLTISGNITDSFGLENASYTIANSNSAQVLSGDLSPRFDKTIDMSDEPDGVLLLTVRAVNTEGKENIERRLLVKDTGAPDVTMVSPASGDKVNGSVTAAFKVREKAHNVKSEYKPSGSSVWKEFEYSSLPYIVVGDANEPIGKNMQFRFTDAAGNATLIGSYDFDIDNSVDDPEVEIHVPVENQVIDSDFELSGIVYDDDAPARIYYKIDNNPYTAVEIKNTFAVPIALSSLTDNEHTISVYAEDIYGVKSQPITRTIRVSLEKPIAELVKPLISETVSGKITVSGTAYDKNGIDKVYISFSNGNVFVAADGTEKWTYQLNTQVIGDGTHVVFIKAVDKYGIETVSSSLINIDNTPPVSKIEYPLAGANLDNDLFVSGQIDDNIFLDEVWLKIKSLSGTGVPAHLAEIKLNKEVLVLKHIDISSLSEGRYNLEISGSDKAGNVGDSAVNFDVYRKKDKDKVELLYPFNGEKLCGEFNVYGKVDTASKITQISLYIDGVQTETADVSKTGYVSFKIGQNAMEDGMHKIELRGISPANTVVPSSTHNIDYSVTGPWVTIDNLGIGDFAVDRPYLRGRAGYTVSPEEKSAAFGKSAQSEDKRAFEQKRLKKVEVSFNNGKTFVPAKLKNGWQYRLETEDMAEGNHFLLVRAVMQNEEVAICRTIVQISKTDPQITLISPVEGGRYNAEMPFVGTAQDNIEFENVEAFLRKGDKSSYAVPKFIKGLHFELGFWGATLWNMGVGLSFLDDHVKLQMHYGQFTQEQFSAIYKAQKRAEQPLRYGGNVASVKLLANVFEMPFGYYFGPDWQWLYLNAALGAQFSLFSETQSGRPQVLSALLTQIEFPRVKLKNRKYFSSFAFFTEGQLWFIPTDVNSAQIKSVIPHICGGVRFDIF
ncbi:MAG: Ig-like domain-containing protein [Treponema lecithinolyticum]|uniref:Ig-like domain-containing protein n=1 Tax=Treponema lecithinolyticum TaxID=53418 RepID=UPI00360EACE2